jgi:hypothetical protein
MKRNTIIFIALPILLSSCLGRLDDISVDPSVLLQSMLSAGAQSPAPAGFTVGGQIYGDTPSGLDLSLSGGTGCGGVQNLSPAATGIYQFVGIPDGCMGTGITITTQPTGVYCQIYNNTGLNVSGANVTGADLYCFSVEMPATTQTTIEGNSNTASIRLSASPGPGGITVNFTSGSGAVTTTASLSFTSANFSTYQNLTLTGAADGNLSSETVTISADVATHAMGGFDTTTLDTTETGMARFIYVTSGTHNGNFASDATLLGSNWVQRADHYCSLNANRPASLVGTGNYRALLTGASTRRSDSGAQLDWPLRAGISYYDQDGTTLFATADASNLFTTPVANLLPGGGDYWTGVGSAPSWTTGSHCASWTAGTTLQTGHFGQGVTNDASLFAFSNFNCDQLKSLLCVQDIRDNGDGTASSVHQNLTWMRCSMGQTYDPATNGCTGAAGTYQYCATGDDSCNGGTSPGLLDGFGPSPMFTACASSTLAGRSWRVPTLAELSELARSYRASPDILPDIMTSYYYATTYAANPTNYYGILFNSSITNGFLVKDSPVAFLLCVSDGM